MSVADRVQRQCERDEQDADDQLERGEITPKEHRDLVREIWRDYNAAADEAAQDAYRNERDQW